MNPDIIVQDHGTVWALMPQNKAATEWLENSTESEGWQWFGHTLCVEPRCGADLTHFARECGLVVEFV